MASHSVAPCSLNSTVKSFGSALSLSLPCSNRPHWSLNRLFNGKSCCIFDKVVLQKEIFIRMNVIEMRRCFIFITSVCSRHRPCCQQVDCVYCKKSEKTSKKKRKKGKTDKNLFGFRWTRPELPSGFLMQCLLWKQVTRAEFLKAGRANRGAQIWQTATEDENTDEVARTGDLKQLFEFPTLWWSLLFYLMVSSSPGQNLQLWPCEGCSRSFLLLLVALFLTLILFCLKKQQMWCRDGGTAAVFLSLLSRKSSSRWTAAKVNIWKRLQTIRKLRQRKPSVWTWALKSKRQFNEIRADCWLLLHEDETFFFFC